MKQPWYKKPWGIITIVFLGGLIIFGIGIYRQTKYYKVEYEKQYKDSIRSSFRSLQDQRIVKNQEVSVNWPDLVTDDDPFFGPDSAKVKIVAFHDFQCAFSKEESQIIRQLKQAYGDKIRFILRDYPNIYANELSLSNAVASECADEQGKFWEMFDLIYDNQEEAQTDKLIKWANQIGMDDQQFKKCIDDGKYELEVKNDLDEGVRAGVDGTPTFFINGQKYIGYLDYQTLVDIIESQL